MASGSWQPTRAKCQHGKERAAKLERKQLRRRRTNAP
jgi:hypothetical protein